MSRDDDGYATVPPPAGEKDAYSAETRVGELPPELIAELAAFREELAAPGNAAPESHAKRAAPPLPPPARRPITTPSAMESRVDRALSDGQASEAEYVDVEEDETALDDRAAPLADEAGEAGEAGEAPLPVSEEAPPTSAPLPAALPLAPPLMVEVAPVMPAEAARSRRSDLLRTILAVLILLAVAIAIGAATLR